MAKTVKAFDLFSEFTIDVPDNVVPAEELAQELIYTLRSWSDTNETNPLGFHPIAMVCDLVMARGEFCKYDCSKTEYLWDQLYTYASHFNLHPVVCEKETIDIYSAPHNLGTLYMVY